MGISSKDWVGKRNGLAGGLEEGQHLVVGRAVDAQDYPSAGTAAPPPPRPALAAAVAAARAAPRAAAHHRASRRRLALTPPPREILREGRRHRGLRALLPPCLAPSLGLGFGGTGVGR